MVTSMETRIKDKVNTTYLAAAILFTPDLRPTTTLEAIDLHFAR